MVRPNNSDAPHRLAVANAIIMLLACGGSAVAAESDSRVEPQPTVSGRVVGLVGPIEDAKVGFQGKTNRVHTNADGRFTLDVESAAERLTASKPGFYIGGIGRHAELPPEIRLRAHPQEDCTNYRWVDPRPDQLESERCGNCHRQIFDEWSQSPHARSTKNRHFLNLYDGTDWYSTPDVGWSLLNEYPDGAAVCSSCHAPSVNVGSPEFSDIRRATGVDSQGIHCDFCHKISSVSVDRVGLNHGRFAIEFLRPPSNSQLFFGPLDDDDRGNSVYSPLYRQSRYCASCHEGILFGTHAYSEYSEWLASDYARQGIQCQDCHMTASGEMENFAPGVGGIKRDPQTLASHASAQGKPETLRRHLKLSVKGTETSHGWRVDAEVTLHGVGHRMPTGYPSRSLILWVTAVGTDGTLLKLLEGPTLPPLAGDGPVVEGNLAGQPGRMYAKMLEDFEGHQPVPYWRAVRIDSDTRLLPDQTDRASFVFEPAEADFVVVAQLIYRRFSKYLADQKSWPDNEMAVAAECWSPNGRAASTAIDVRGDAPHYRLDRSQREGP